MNGVQNINNIQAANEAIMSMKELQAILFLSIHGGARLEHPENNAQPQASAGGNQASHLLDMTA